MEELFIPATFTFSDKHGHINEFGTRNYIRYLIKKGVTGFYVNGSTGEAFLLSIEERMRALEIIREEVPANSLLIAQIGCIATAESIALAKHAQSVGVDAISAITPFYFKFSWNEVLSHYLEIMESVDLAFCPYHIPNLSGVDASKRQLSTLLENPQVQYLKYSSNDFYTLERLHKMFPNVTIFNGYDEMLLSGLVAGAGGAIGSTYNFTFSLAINLAHSLQKGYIEDAKILQDEMNTFVDLLLNVGIWQGAKYLFDKLGIVSSVPSRPFLPITDSNKKIVDDFFEKHQQFFQ